ncbi:MAG: hypothetical protein COW73_01065 [Nitrospirae bacterium CG18_big_fil_WC_8_21_14_2_50_70_55]|nr:MAG: hypothetical protein AUK30_06640 [Nitrospirae bacterium CG2_30_70_394]PIQ07107.1 MAG: hypothetical protein COW73_01065 [Nitrospirae bacterium CG18_big_fil_WC_8_21_14_2_50_70_55]PIU77430.1 MAG: hypothetical protein COS73_10600 [Nitrospirae bacterium CG06_land_8_20_14_3_00_70_43]PIW82179.1 MAG: hypothetical protein COZ96_10055 [Nitrospirae bacterium CG_4_8_14_3_um_filter_70_85]HBB40033.1 hypothetical protein [Pseudomonadota bacterium]
MKRDLDERGRERGAVLVVSLFLLVVLTLLGLTAMQGTTMETRIASNREDQSIAFEAAEAALRQGEAVIQAMTTPPIPVSAACVADCGVWAPGALFVDYDAYRDPAVWADPRIPVAGDLLAGVAAPPAYAIELISIDTAGGSLLVGWTGGRYYFQVTARGTGASSAAHVVLQSSVVRFF